LFIQRRFASSGGVKAILALFAIAAITAAVWFTMGRGHGEGTFWKSSPSVAAASTGSPDENERQRDALLKFRGLSHFPVESRPTFRSVQSLAEVLPTSQLVPLIDEFDRPMHKGIDGWRRAALWAEIGKREPAMGKALLESRFPLQERPQDPDNPFSEDAGPSEDTASFMARLGSFQRHEEEANLAAFAYLRGRIEACDLTPQALEPLIADFHSLAEGISNEGWSSQVDELLFRSLARRNPELAWQILPGAKKESPLTHHRAFFTYPAFQGFFDGLDSRKEVSDYAYRWLDYWKSAEVKATYYAGNGRVDEQWDYRSTGISCIIVDTLDRLAPEAIDAWVEASPYYDEADLKRRTPEEDPSPGEHLLEFPEEHRAFIPKGWSKP
jgi:hypothetical protein